MQWAAVGSRISGFHHDSASKLQSLMMALDESTELIGDDRPEVARSLAVAMTSLRELHALLTENRALAKAPARKDIKLAELLKRASSRAGVKLTGDIPDLTVHVAPPSMVHAIGLLLDVHAGSQQGARVIAIETRAETRAIVALTGTAPQTSALDPITIATWLVEREDGAVFSAPAGVQLHLPLAVTP
jgi:hypothetical protein